MNTNKVIQETFRTFESIELTNCDNGIYIVCKLNDGYVVGDGADKGKTAYCCGTLKVDQENHDLIGQIEHLHKEAKRLIRRKNNWIVRKEDLDK
jgi:hypothetical protein